MTDDNRELLLRLVESRADIDARFTGIRRVGDVGGGGYFSLVFTATDATTDAVVALKVLNPRVTDQYRRQCFAREEELLRTFVGQSDIIGWVSGRSSFSESISTHIGLPLRIDFEYYALEYAQSNLEDLIYGEAAPFTARLEAFRRGCRGLQRIHAARMAHRDLKPSNILLMADGTARLADLGTARIIDSVEAGLLASYSGPPGDLRYAPPELLACLHDVDPRYAAAADFYSLGTILFELSTANVFNLTVLPKRIEAGLSALCYAREEDRVSMYRELTKHWHEFDVPSVADFGVVPTSVSQLVDALCRDLTMIGFDQRLTDFPSLFRRINSILIVLRNEVAFARWTRRRETVRLARAAKEARRRERLARMLA